MNFHRCKCGEKQCWESGMPPPRCTPCEKCGTVPGPGPNAHPDPIPHEFTAVSEVETDEGMKKLTRCRWCHKTKAEIEYKKGEKDG